MTLNEVCKMSYDEYVQYLLNKYGKATQDYFCSPDCKSKNPKVTRTKEGLECHHIDEDKYPLLSKPISAQMFPFECQKADRLLYADKIEHIILHIKIAEMGTAGDYRCGTRFLIGSTNTMFDTPPTSGWQLNMYNKIKANFDLYIEILHRLSKQLDNTVDITTILTEDQDKLETVMPILSIIFATDPNSSSNNLPQTVIKAFISHESQEDYEFI